MDTSEPHDRLELTTTDDDICDAWRLVTGPCVKAKAVAMDVDCAAAAAVREGLALVREADA